MTHKKALKMKQLNKVENIIFLMGAVMIVVGSIANVMIQPWAPYIFAMGTVAFVLMQLKQSYEGNNVVIRRLRRMVVASDLFFVITAVLMFANINNLFGLDRLSYLQYVRNNWVVTLLIAALLQLYSNHRLGKELSEEQKKS